MCLLAPLVFAAVWINRICIKNDSTNDQLVGELHITVTMMKMKFGRMSTQPAAQRGMVLIVGLIMVLLMAMVGVAAIRGSNLQELMAGNMKDRNQAFQAAEAALRMGEILVQTSEGSLTFNDTNGLFTNQNLSGSALGTVTSWSDDVWKAKAVKLAKSKLDLKLSRTPEYVIERLEVSASGTAASGGAIEYGANIEEGGPTVLYRITSRGFGGSETSAVIVQSTYRAQH